MSGGDGVEQIDGCIPHSMVAVDVWMYVCPSHTKSSSSRYFNLIKVGVSIYICNT